MATLCPCKGLLGHRPEWASGTSPLSQSHILAGRDAAPPLTLNGLLSLVPWHSDPGRSLPNFLGWRTERASTPLRPTGLSLCHPSPLPKGNDFYPCLRHQPSRLSLLAKPTVWCPGARVNCRVGSGGTFTRLGLASLGTWASPICQDLLADARTSMRTWLIFRELTGRSKGLAWSKTPLPKAKAAKPLLNICLWAVLGNVSLHVSLPAVIGRLQYKGRAATKDT